MKLSTDKILHFIAGMSIGLIVFRYTLDYKITLNIVFIIGALKEFYDKYSGRGTCEVKDFLATALGGVVVCGLFYFIKEILKVAY